MMNEQMNPGKTFSGWQGLTVGQWVARHPGSARIFEIHGIDYCCGGKRTLEDACAGRGLDAAALREELASSLDETPAEPGIDWGSASLADLVDHIEQTHHRYIREEEPRLKALARKVAQVHGQRHPELIALSTVVEKVFSDLEPHLDQEEKILFPACRKSGAAGSGAAPDPVLATVPTGLEAEHLELGKLLETIRNLTSGFELPQDACNSYLALFHGLEHLEADLHEHIHKENNILHARLAGIAGLPEG